MVQFAFQRAIEDRASFTVEALEAARPREDLVPGDAVLCRGERARLDWYDEASGRCGVAFSCEGVEEVVVYSSRFNVKGQPPQKGCARLQRPQPSLMPPPRAVSQLSVSPDTKAHVAEVFALTCPTSPHQKDMQKRHLARHVVQVCQPSTTQLLEHLGRPVLSDHVPRCVVARPDGAGAHPSHHPRRNLSHLSEDLSSRQACYDPIQAAKALEFDQGLS